MKTKINTDEQLVKLICEKNNQELFSQIMSRYQSKLYYYIYRYTKNREDSEDILQDVFLKAFRNLRSFDTKRKFSSWIYRIAHNETVNHLKFIWNKKNISIDGNEYLKNTLGEHSNIENELDQKESIKKLKKLIDNLPLKYKDIIILRYFEDKSYEEISDIIRKPISTVGTLINRAKNKIKNIVKKNNEFGVLLTYINAYKT